MTAATKSRSAFPSYPAGIAPELQVYLEAIRQEIIALQQHGVSSISISFNGGALNVSTTLNFSTDFSLAQTLLGPAVYQTNISLAATQPNAHTWLATQTFGSGVGTTAFITNIGVVQAGDSFRIARRDNGTVTWFMYGQNDTMLRFFDGTTDRVQFKNGGEVDVITGPLIAGADPGGTDTLRVGANGIATNSWVDFYYSAGNVAGSITGISTPALEFGIGGAIRSLMTTTAFSPNASTGITLGTSALPWGTLFVGATVFSSTFPNITTTLAAQLWSTVPNTVAVFNAVQARASVAFSNPTFVAALSGTAYAAPASGTLANATGTTGAVEVNSGTVDVAQGLVSDVFTSGTGHINKAYAIAVDGPDNFDSGTMDTVIQMHTDDMDWGTHRYNLFLGGCVSLNSPTDCYGIWIDPVSGASGNNYAIYTNTGPIRFGDTLLVTKNAAVGSLASVLSTVGLSVFAGLTGGTTQAGMVLTAAGDSGGTTALNALGLSIQTAAAAYTVTTGRGIRINDASLGASSAITTQVGLDIDSQTKGGTNYAIRTGTGLSQFGDKVQLKMGAAAAFSTGLGLANCQSGSTANSGVGETDLMTFSVPASALTVNSQGVRLHAWGTTANNANSKTLKLKFGATSVTLISGMTTGGNGWWVDARIVRTGSNAQEIHIFRFCGDAATTSVMFVANSTETETGAIVLKLTGTGGATNDIIQQGMDTDYADGS